MSVKQMKKQLAIAALSVVMAAVALGSATYAWFVSNTKVDGTTSTVSAQANGMVLQIASAQMPFMTVAIIRRPPQALAMRSVRLPRTMPIAGLYQNHGMVQM